IVNRATDDASATVTLDTGITRAAIVTSLVMAGRPDVLFFFSCFRARRNLHSFPTRRSSDLKAPQNSSSATPEFASGPEFIAADRSEEHTSELQSLRHLVCRLLLEKKKKIESQ